MIRDNIITTDVQKAILEALRNGNTVELKVEHGRLVVIEIKRIVRIKQE